jgi:quinol-cytochrome oxidoreductase complex cytochrome b subunit
VRSARFRPLYRIFFWVLVIDCFVLGYVGCHPPEGSYIVLGKVATLYYFLHFFVLVPWIARTEKPLPLPESISKAVLG